MRSSGPLAGVRVLDLTTTFLGPYCTLLLGDLGAEVVKIEHPDGDITRHLGARRNEGMSSVFLQANRNKRSVVIDLKSEQGHDVFLRLVENADIVVHNMRSRSAAQLKIDYDACVERRPDLIYCSAVGFGRRGPYADRPAYDDIIQGLSGLASLQSVDSGEPRYIATAIADKTAGLSAALAIVAALRWRERTGVGQWVEVPMFETMVAFTLIEHMGGMAFDPPEGPTRYERMISPYRKPYRTLDGYVCVMLYTERHWRDFFRLTGHEELLEDSRFDTVAKRIENVDELYSILEAIIKERRTSEWLEALSKIDVPVAPLSSVDNVFEDPHLNEVSLFDVRDHPSEGRIRQMRVPFEFGETALSSYEPAPRLGQHTVEVLRESGFAAEEIERLLLDRAVMTEPHGMGADE